MFRDNTANLTFDIVAGCSLLNGFQISQAFFVSRKSCLNHQVLRISLLENVVFVIGLDVSQDEMVQQYKIIYRKEMGVSFLKPLFRQRQFLIESQGLWFRCLTRFLWLRPRFKPLWIDFATLFFSFEKLLPLCFSLRIKIIDHTATSFNQKTHNLSVFLIPPSAQANKPTARTGSPFPM